MTWKLELFTFWKIAVFLQGSSTGVFILLLLPMLIWHRYQASLVVDWSMRRLAHLWKTNVDVKWRFKSQYFEWFSIGQSFLNLRGTFTMFMLRTANCSQYDRFLYDQLAAVFPRTPHYVVLQPETAFWSSGLIWLAMYLVGTFFFSLDRPRKNERDGCFWVVDFYLFLLDEAQILVLTIFLPMRLFF